MKLPRPGTRRYQILRALMGKRLTLDEIVAGYGLFRLDTRSHLMTELKSLRELGYLDSRSNGFALTDETEVAMREMGESETQIVEPRRYNVYDAPPLKPTALLNPLRRKSEIEDAPSLYGDGK